MRAITTPLGLLISFWIIGFVDLAAAQEITKGKALLMSSDGYHLPFSNSDRGRQLFLHKGCVICHSIKGVGGAIGPPLDANSTQAEIDPFEFAARMWSGAEAMIALQNLELGFQIELNGQELADIARFLHDYEAQQTFHEDEISADVRPLMRPELLKELEL